MKHVFVALVLLLLCGGVVAGAAWEGRLGTADKGFWEKDSTLVSTTIWTGRLSTGDFQFWANDTILCAHQHEMIGAPNSGGHQLPANTNLTIKAAAPGGMTVMWWTDALGHLIIGKGTLGTHPDGHQVPKNHITLDPMFGPNGEVWYECTQGTGSEHSTIKFQFWGDDPRDPDAGGNWVGAEFNPDNPDEQRSNMSKYNTWK
ncbi:MAG: hypothetical protein GY906_12865 [bacterium]|nr:hypothetical protein [bacterium]